MRDRQVKDVVVVSLSMGAVSGLNIVAQDAIPHLSAWVGISPVTNLAAMDAQKAWKGPISTALTPSQVKQLNPMTLNLPSTVPLTIYSGSTDTTTPTSTRPRDVLPLG